MGNIGKSERIRIVEVTGPSCSGIIMKVCGHGARLMQDLPCQDQVMWAHSRSKMDPELDLNEGDRNTSNIFRSSISPREILSTAKLSRGLLPK
jgi:hypothetical protein